MRIVERCAAVVVASPVRASPRRRALWALCVLSLTAHAGQHPHGVFAVRGAEDQARAFVNAAPNSILIQDHTAEFENGNTFPRVSTPLMGMDVDVVVPTVMSADQLMEALIKVNIARVNLARRIGVSCQTGADQVRIVLRGGQELRLPLQTLFAVAGARAWTQLSPAPVVSAMSAPATPEPILHDPSRAVVQSLSHPALSRELAQGLNFPLLETGAPSSTLRDALVFLVAPPVAPTNDSFFRALSELSALSLRNNSTVLITPYLPYARSDKIDQRGVAVVGRLVADLIEASGARAVVFVRAHAPQSQGFFRIPSFNLTARGTLTRFLRNEGVEMVVSPDAGFEKDATFYGDELGVPVAVINKHRDPTTGRSQIRDISGPSVAGKTVVVIDDETASGKTLGDTAHFLKNLGAKRVLAAVSHLAGKADKALENLSLDLLVVTNTLPNAVPEGPRFKTLSITEELLPLLVDLGASFTEALDCNESLTKT